MFTITISSGIISSYVRPLRIIVNVFLSILIEILQQVFLQEVFYPLSSDFVDIEISYYKKGQVNNSYYLSLGLEFPFVFVSFTKSLQFNPYYE